MKRLAALLFATSMLTASALADPAPFTVKVKGIDNGARIPARFAYCMPDGKGKTKDADNINPGIEWSGAPAGTQSYALIMVDRDVPQTFDNANQDGKTLPHDMPRQDFYHWVLTDIPVSMVAISEGADSRGIVSGGKQLSKTPYGQNGQNDYARVYPGTFGGYDGPCPPWNDERIHHYYFIVYALDLPTLGLNGTFNGRDAEEAMRGHILAKGEVMGTYVNNKMAR